MSKPKRRNRAYRSAPIRLGDVIRTANGGRKFDRGKTMIVWAKTKDPRAPWRRTSVSTRSRGQVAQWSPEQVQLELADAKACTTLD